MMLHRVHSNNNTCMFSIGNDIIIGAIGKLQRLVPFDARRLMWASSNLQTASPGECCERELGRLGVCVGEMQAHLLLTVASGTTGGESMTVRIPRTSSGLVMVELPTPIPDHA